MRRHAAHEDGFTLVEVVAAVAVLGIVSVVIAAAFGVGARTVRATTDHAANATALRSLSIYLPPDVHAATDAVASATGAGITCAGVDEPRLRLLGDGVDIVYGVRQIGGDWVLERHDCASGTASATIVVARNLAGIDAAEPTRTPPGGPFDGASITITGKSTTGDTVPALTVTGSRRTS